MRKTKHFWGLLLFCLLPLAASGQHFNLKTNVLYDATATFNLGAEIGLGTQTSLDVSGNYNPWSFTDKDRQWKHWMVQPEFRYWLCERFNGHFFGVHALAGEYNVNRVKLPFDILPSLNKYNYQGNFFGGGISYGYEWILSKHWGLEATIGVGYLRVKYDQYQNPDCGTKLESGHKNYFGPTKAGITFTYFIY